MLLSCKSLEKLCFDIGKTEKYAFVFLFDKQNKQTKPFHTAIEKWSAAYTSLCPSLNHFSQSCILINLLHREKEELTCLSEAELGMIFIERQELKMKMSFEDRAARFDTLDDLEFYIWLKAQNVVLGELDPETFVLCKRYEYAKVKQGWIETARQKHGL